MPRERWSPPPDLNAERIASLHVALHSARTRAHTAMSLLQGAIHDDVAAVTTWRGLMNAHPGALLGVAFLIGLLLGRRRSPQLNQRVP
jgi:hypothetical protein